MIIVLKILTCSLKGFSQLESPKI